jgi:nesprin-1
MSDKQIKQPGWVRPSPIRSNPPRLMSPTAQPRQRSPTPTFNARQLTETPPFSQTQQSPTPPLRRTMPQTPTGFTTVYESHRFSPSHPIPPQQKSIQQQQQNIPMSPINLPSDLSFPRPYRSTFSPAPTASTPCSIPPFSPTPMFMERHDHGKSMNDFYVVPLEPANLGRGVTVYDEENENRPSTADIIAQQSQDYVDEKLAEYQATITYLQGMHRKFNIYNT